MSILTWVTSGKFLFTATAGIFTSTTIVTSASTATFQVIAGKLPNGLSLSSSGTIAGIPSPVTHTVHSRFVVRAADTAGIADKTFSIDVKTANIGPQWQTSSILAGPSIGNAFVDRNFISIPLTAVAPTSITENYTIY